MGRHKTLVMTDEPHSHSPAAGVLLRRQLRKAQVGEWLEFREAYLDEQLAEHGDLVCHYCSTPNLVKEVSEPVTKSKLRLLATVDHVHPRSKGGAEYDKDNLVVACYPCNQQKGGTRLLYD